jgi:hypothetical protein
MSKKKKKEHTQLFKVMYIHENQIAKLPILFFPNYASLKFPTSALVK